MSKKLVSSLVFNTSLGWIGIAAGAQGIVRTTLPEPEFNLAAEKVGHLHQEGCEDANGLLEDAQSLLTRYCSGEVASLNQIPIDHGNASEFTRSAREACRTIPLGETRTYGWLAHKASGNHRAARAAGRAMATNPLPLIVPCHRVIGSDGGLHGFGGSLGLSLKARLLKMEGFNLS